MAVKDTTRWYAVRTVPGSQRMAKALEGMPAHRKDESVIERQLRNQGIDVYMPSFKIEVKHHRTNEIIERRLPLLVGYAFVHLPNLEFEKVRGVEGVMCMLAPSRNSGPIRFPETTIAKLMLAEFDACERHLHDQRVRTETAKFMKAEGLRGQLKKILPKGRARTVSMREWADRFIDNLNDGARPKVLGIIKELDSLYADEAVAEIAKVA
ncbi:hypothetical protein LJR235_002908 [Pararhizobium sp. LjRoot235]|uniref:transcription termination/antitermination NusG family protein n=1 Tax=Pararhizobium sp. LjRoot235 TaxID=3342291 RepID=UPI003ECD79F4